MKNLFSTSGFALAMSLLFRLSASAETEAEQEPCVDNLKLFLWDAENDQRLGFLPNNGVIDLCLAKSFSIQAVNPCEEVKQKFILKTADNEFLFSTLDERGPLFMLNKDTYRAPGLPRDVLPVDQLLIPGDYKLVLTLSTGELTQRFFTTKACDKTQEPTPGPTPNPTSRPSPQPTPRPTLKATPAPTPPPINNVDTPGCAILNQICEGGETCCGGLGCRATLGGRLICQPPDDIPSIPGVCKGTGGGCGSGERCCNGLTCQWSPGNHRTCLIPCKKEHETCSASRDCCFGFECENGKCIPHRHGAGCDFPGVGHFPSSECRRTTLYGTCIQLCCTNGRLTFDYSPLALDVDQSGFVERISAVDLKFDITGNGKLEDLHEWFAPSEGILVNTNIPGKVLTGVHLFGDEGGKYNNGFEKLTLLDKNFDGVISGSELNGLRLWFDKNSNAVLDRGEMQTLDEHHVISLSVEHFGNVGHATLEDGHEIRMEDLWFEGEETGEDLYFDGGEATN